MYLWGLSFYWLHKVPDMGQNTIRYNKKAYHYHFLTTIIAKCMYSNARPIHYLHWTPSKQHD